MGEGDAEGLVFVKQKLPSYGQMPPVAFQASDVQLASSGPRMVIMGGQRRGITGEMWIFDTNGDGWMQVQPDTANGFTATIPERTQSTLVALGVEPQTSTLVFGGYVLNVGEANDLWRSDISPDPNTSMPVAAHTKIEAGGTPPCPRYGHSATIVEQSMIVIGGQNGTDQFSDVWSLSIDPYVWSVISTEGPAPTPRSQHTATLVDGQILVLGGFNRKERVLGDAHMLDISNKSAIWRSWEVTTGLMPPPRAQHTATLHPDGHHIYIFGGYDGEKNHKDLWLMNVPDAAAAELRCSVKPEARSRHSSHIIGSQLYVFCGHDGMKPHLSEVWTLEVDDVKGHLARAFDELQSNRKVEEEDKKNDDDD
ncbi:hypothetical protein AB1Y20_015508 [Prymnesium parvum]|uniref:Galactose oxidase n=1 Tax=Prymnesium parvum TaxID=97485 RepID=A0AB34K1Q9_PRYPA